MAAPMRPAPIQPTDVIGPWVALSFMSAPRRVCMLSFAGRRAVAGGRLT